MNERGVEPPEHHQLVADLEALRRAGIVKINQLDLPALVRTARAAGDIDPDTMPTGPALEETLRRGVVELDGGRLEDCAALLFGLESGTRAYSPTELRRDAAERWGVSEARFRRDPQHLILSEIANALLRRAHRYQERLAHLALERRLPPTSRLAVAWLERFEAYYSVWSPLSGLGADLTAYRSTLLERARPYDRDPDPGDPSDKGYSQERQAEGYVSYALWYFTMFLVVMRTFEHRYGGLWLLSDAQAEQDVADAIYRASWHTPNNDSDDSYLRLLYERAGGEVQPFRKILASDAVAHDIEDEWLHWAALCQCRWDDSARSEREHFPTHRHHEGIEERCQVHSVIAAANDYCVLIDDDWRRIADWYRLPTGMLNPVSSEGLYSRLRLDIKA